MFRRRSQLRRIGNWPPDIAVSSWSLRYLISRGELNIMGFPSFAKKRFGVEYIEVLLNHLGEGEIQFQRLAEAASSAGVKIVCLALNNDFTLAGTALAQECVRTSDLLRKAKILGAEVARVNPGMGGSGTDEELARNVAKGLRSLIPAASETGILLALENHGLFGISPDNILRVLDETDAPQYVGACLDFGNFLPEYRDTGPAKLAPHAVYVHAKSYKFDEDENETKISYLDRIRELKDEKYTGYLSVEWEGKQEEDEAENIQRTIQLVKRCLAQLE